MVRFLQPSREVVHMVCPRREGGYRYHEAHARCYRIPIACNSSNIYTLKNKWMGLEGALTFAVVAVLLRTSVVVSLVLVGITPQTGSVLQVVELVFCVCCNLIG